MRRACIVILALGFFSWLTLNLLGAPRAQVNAATASSSVGVEGTVPGAPPTRGATITFPANGQVFTSYPITVTGICPAGLLVKLFKNNVFGGSAQCSGGSFSIVTDLFSGRNDLIARVYDELDQAGPDSNTVSIIFNDARGFRGNSFTLTTNFAKRGTNPGETLTWPMILSGGTPPYAISVSWGDSKAPDLISQPGPGGFDIRHIYDSSGVYTVVIKASDRDGNAAFLQLVGVANGPLSQKSTEPKGPTVITKTLIPWWPAALSVVFIIVAFWLGRRHELYSLRKRLE